MTERERERKRETERDRQTETETEREHNTYIHKHISHHMNNTSTHACMHARISL